MPCGYPTERSGKIDLKGCGNCAKLVAFLEESREYDGFFKIDKAILQYEKFNGRMSEKITRLNFERCNSAAVLLYDEERDSVILGLKLILLKLHKTRNCGGDT